jgi:hypothetical protein
MEFIIEKEKERDVCAPIIIFGKQRRREKKEKIGELVVGHYCIPKAFRFFLSFFSLFF